MIGLELNPRATDSGDFAGSIGNLAGGGTVGNLAINSGTATYALTLSGTGHSYTGSTTVTKGILRLTNNSALPDTTTVYIPNSSNGKIHLDFTGTDYIAGLVLGGGTPLASGTYNATTHPAYFTGGGSLTVGSPPSVNPYDTWAGGGPGLPFDGDANGDGVDNGLAFLLGAAGPNVNALGKLPAPTESAGGLNLAFQMLPSTTRGGATLAIEHGNGLANGSWTTVAVPDTSGTVGDVIFTITGTNPLNVIATIPASKAAAGKLFGRLKAVKP
jgi:autotransporter-associated beta strand protein